MFVQKKVDPSLQVDVRPVYSRRIKDERDCKQQDDMRRRYVEDKWRLALFCLLSFFSGSTLCCLIPGFCIIYKSAS